ncbi:hypothetical protein IWQ62_002636 [Dispira parvispora]|uniref:Uncharacterized protein n=1 Tax=Dispira parvispora TaxID=1520584 RepID=A0A9W8AQ14_9FUNG|nr:hypothetical protein IWQ62_002636 [Dispira parvispora]
MYCPRLLYVTVFFTFLVTVICIQTNIGELSPYKGNQEYSPTEKLQYLNLKLSQFGISRNSDQPVPRRSNAVHLVEEVRTPTVSLISRAIRFPQFTNIAVFKQTVDSMDLPGKVLHPLDVEKTDEEYLVYLKDLREEYTQLASKPVRHKPNHSVKDQIMGGLQELERYIKSSFGFSPMAIFDERFNIPVDSNRPGALAIQRGQVLVVVYCKPMDKITYVEVLWFPGRRDHSVDRVLAYMMRTYEHVDTFAVDTDSDYDIFMGTLREILVNQPVNICSLVADETYEFSEYAKTIL